MLRVTPLIRERIKLLRDVLTAADFFFVDQLPPYDPAELIPQKGDAAMALRVLRAGREVLARRSSNMIRWIRPCAQAAAGTGSEGGADVPADSRGRVRTQECAAVV